MIRKILLALSLATLIAIPAGHADDIDIYMTPGISNSDVPIVMFTLDYRANLANTVCQSGSCDFLLYQTNPDGSYVMSGGSRVPLTYTNSSGVTKPYLTLSGGTTSRFNLLRASLKYVLQRVGPSASSPRIGFAMSHQNSCTGSGLKAGPTPATGNCSNGGYILQGATSMASQAARDSLYAKLDALPDPQGNLARDYQGTEIFFELFRYFTGQGWYNMKNGWDDQIDSNVKVGNNVTKYNIDQAADYTPNTGNTPFIWDSSIVTGANYSSPLASAGPCTKLYTINILFGVSGADTESNDAITATAANGGMDKITTIGSLTGGNALETVVRWMHDHDFMSNVADVQGVTSYFIVGGGQETQVKSKGYPGAGIGTPTPTAPYTLSDNASTLVKTLSTIFDNILSVSTTFVAPSVAVNVYNRSQVRDEVFIAMFKADENRRPGWPGNLKKYKLSSNQTQILDTVPADAVDSQSGRVATSAISYWTIPGDLPAPSTTSSDIILGKDGRNVDRGGAGSKIPGVKLNCVTTADTVCYPGAGSPGLTNPTGNTTNATARKLFTEPASYTAGTATALRALNADTSTATALQGYLGATSVGTCASTDADATSACNLLIYARGGVFYTDASNNTSLKSRGWVLGDLLHSRPLAINYGARSGSSYTTDNPDIRIVAGSNDGVMHMFRNTREGGAPAPNADSFDGVETWGFMPLEVMSTTATLMKANVVTPPHPYTVDGAPNAYILDWNGNGNIEPTDSDGNHDKVLLFFGLRRGGYAYYALDITNPDDPKMLWKIKRGDAGFEELGQTWSRPEVGMMLYDGSTTSRPALIFGGGYDPNKDTHIGHASYSGTAKGTNDSMGYAIYIVNAETGTLVWKATQGASNGYNSTTRTYTRTDMLDSIPSEVLQVDSDANGLIDRIYVGDTGGVMWRVDTSCRSQTGNDPTSGASICPEGGWTINPLFSIGRHDQDNLVDDRRFFYPPSYVQTVDSSGKQYDAISTGSGDRENPLDTTVVNWFYTYRDYDTSSGTVTSTLSTHTNFGDVTNNCLQDSPGAGCSPNLSVGWRLKLECPNLFVGSTPPTVCGEKNLAKPIVVNGKVYFNTYIPASASSSAGSCALQEGTGLTYAVALQDASAVEDYNPNNNTAAKNLFKSDRYTGLRSGGIPAESVSLGGGKILRPDLNIQTTTTTAGYRTFWYEKYRP